MKSFNDDNTEGYTVEELNELNAEWEGIVESESLEEYTEEYYIREKQFADDVARR